MTEPRERDIVERDCRECKGSGVAEYIDHMARPCDACHGEGTQNFTAMEAALLDQCEQQQAEILRLRSLLEAPDEVSEVNVYNYQLNAIEEREKAAIRASAQGKGDA